MSEYVGITIGPIFDTLQLAESPAALWYASSCFSELARLLLCEISTQLPDATIISPYYSGVKYTDGVGRYHDRILLETASAQKLEPAIAAAKTAIVDMVLADIAPTADKAEGFRTYLNNYFQIHYVTLPKAQCQQNNILSEISPLLDALECMPICNPSRENNPFKVLFSTKGEDSGSRNRRIKESALRQDVSDSQLFEKSGNLKSIESICHSNKALKTSNYFAVVSADGDGMSSFFSGMDNEAVRKVSENCFVYAEAAAAEIKKFGGMIVYAGGDDLLFLAPIQSPDGETIFEFCNRLSSIFTEKVSGNQPFPSVSFGIAIRYMRFPLYEALNAAYAALEDAKQSRPEKNAFAIDLQKHSGQSIQLCITKEGFPLFNSILRQSLQQDDETVNSIIYVLEKFAASIYTDAKDLRTKNVNVFLNHYDNASQKKYQNYIKAIAELCCDFLECGELITSQADDAQSKLKCFEGILRIGKFLVERGSENV